MRFFAFFLLLNGLVLTACTTGPSEDETSAQLYINLGASQLSQGHSHRALKSFLNAKKLDPNNSAVYNQLGLTYFALKKYKESAENFEQALSINDKLTESRINYGRALIELKRFSEAREHLETALTDLTYPQPYLVYLNLGLSYFEEKKYRKAIPLLQKSISLERKNCLSNTYYARSLYEIRDYHSANKIFDIALPLCKPLNYDVAHYYAALSYFKSGDKYRGIALMNETILQYPDGDMNQKAQNLLELMKLNRL